MGLGFGLYHSTTTPGWDVILGTVMLLSGGDVHCACPLSGTLDEVRHPYAVNSCSFQGLVILSHLRSWFGSSLLPLHSTRSSRPEYRKQLALLLSSEGTPVISNFGIFQFLVVFSCDIPIRLPFLFWPVNQVLLHQQLLCGCSTID